MTLQKMSQRRADAGGGVMSGIVPALAAPQSAGHNHAMSPNYTFLWHDYETFGLNPRRDRPAQFAGIRTDAELNEVGEPVMIYCQPASDYLPDPASCLITGITPRQ